MNRFGNPSNSLTNRKLNVRALNVSSIDTNKFVRFSDDGTLEATDSTVQDLGPTGDVNFNSLTLAGNLTVAGTQTTISSTDLVITDSIIVLANGGTDTQNAGLTINHGGKYSGLIRDKTTKKFNLYKDKASLPTAAEAITYDYADLNVNTLDTLSGLVDGVDIIARDAELTVAQTKLALINQGVATTDDVQFNNLTVNGGYLDLVPNFIHGGYTAADDLTNKGTLWQYYNGEERYSGLMRGKGGGFHLIDSATVPTTLASTATDITAETHEDLTVGAVTFGAYDTDSRDLIAPTRGMTIFNTDINRLQSYSGGWNTVGKRTLDYNSLGGLGLLAVTYSGSLGLYVGVNADSSSISTSTDGITWSAGTGPVSTTMIDVGWSPTSQLFELLTQSGTTRCYTSPDGATWSACSPLGVIWRETSWIPELDSFLNTSNTGSNAYLKSVDLPSTQPATGLTPVSSRYNNACWSDELGLLLVSATMTALAPDGLAFVEQGLPGSLNWTRGAWSPLLKLFVIVGSGHTAWSSDGSTWTENLLTGLWTYVWWIAEKQVFVAVSSDGDFYESSDGKTTWASVYSSGQTITDVIKIPTGLYCITDTTVSLFVSVSEDSLVVDSITTSAITYTDDNVRLGSSAGITTQGTDAVAIGTSAGNNTQGNQSVAIGLCAGETGQLDRAIAIGQLAGQTTQGAYSIAMGFNTASSLQGLNAVAIGAAVASSSQGDYSVAMGSNAGGTQGDYSLALGPYAGKTTTHANSIILNANAAELNSVQSDSFYASSIREGAVVAGTGSLMYNSSTKEVYSNSDRINTPLQTLTTTQRNALTGTDGMEIFNTTDDSFDWYDAKDAVWFSRGAYTRFKNQDSFTITTTTETALENTTGQFGVLDIWDFRLGSILKTNATLNLTVPTTTATFTIKVKMHGTILYQKVLTIASGSTSLSVHIENTISCRGSIGEITASSRVIVEDTVDGTCTTYIGTLPYFGTAMNDGGINASTLTITGTWSSITGSNSANVSSYWQTYTH